MRGKKEAVVSGEGGMVWVDGMRRRGVRGKVRRRGRDGDEMGWDGLREHEQPMPGIRTS